MKPLLLYYEMLNFDQANMDLLHEHFYVHKLKSPDADNQIDLTALKAVFAPLGYNMNAAKMDKMPALRVIGSNTTSTPHIDEKAASERGIQVFSLKNDIAFLESITATAEFTWSLILSLTRNTERAAQSVISGKWSRWEFGGEKMLSRMTIGIVGMGRIGKIVTRQAHGFGMRVLFYDPFVEAHEHAEKMDSIFELAQHIDILSIHVHLSPDTTGLINDKVFKAMKPQAIMINTARGAIVDTASLINALNSGQIAGAAIDVLDDEFEQSFSLAVTDHPLVQYAKAHSNLIITPHIAGSTRDAWHLTQRHTIEKMIDFDYS
jgi:D-3-phosphoglycerate dehydrogenase